MIKNFFIVIVISFLTISKTSFGDVKETREFLSNHCNSNKEVLGAFDRISSSWVKYKNKNSKEWDLEKLLKVVEYAAEKHFGQTRKDAGKTPYIIHPIGVTELLWDIGNIRSINVLSAALLHDTLEDTDATEEKIRELFGERVLTTVKEVTNDPTLSTQDNKQRQIAHAPTMSFDGQLVKLADRLYNVKDLDLPPPEWSDKKVDEYFVWGEKLLSVLTGTNEGLESALKKLIENHKNSKKL